MPGGVVLAKRTFGNINAATTKTIAIVAQRASCEADLDPKRAAAQPITLENLS